METRHVKAALSAMTVKTDRRDARGMAQLLRMGWFRPVHAKSLGSQEVRALLVARKQLQHKLRDIELSIRGILRGFGLKVGHVTDKTFETRIRKLVTGHAMLEQIAAARERAAGSVSHERRDLDQSDDRQGLRCRGTARIALVAALVPPALSLHCCLLVLRRDGSWRGNVRRINLRSSSPTRARTKRSPTS